MQVVNVAFMLGLALVVGLDAQAIELTGSAPGGSPYRIVVPDGWQPGDGLVLAQQGYRLAATSEPDLGPVAEAVLATGYAIAAPGYRQTGWALFDAVDDNAEVLRIFRAEVGEPGRVLAVGDSMGALVAIKLSEAATTRDDIDGVLAFCPIVDGHGMWERAFDLRIAYDTLCGDVPDGALPEGEAPHPWASPLSVLQRAPSDFTGLAAAARGEPAVQACLQLERPAMDRSTDAADRVSALQALLGLQTEEALAHWLGLSLFGISDLVRSEDKLADSNPFFNRDLIDVSLSGSGPSYIDLWYQSRLHPLLAEVEEHAPRIRRDPFARLELARASLPEGSASTRILAVQTSRDEWVSASTLSLLARRMEHAELYLASVEESTPSHCGFTQAERDAAWDRFVNWTRVGAPLPGIGPLQSQCLARGGESECRFDLPTTQAAAAAPIHDNPRIPLTEWAGEYETWYGGLWYDPARPAQGIFIEELDDEVPRWRRGEQRVAVSWYTWAPQNDPNPGPRWLYGVGRVLFDAIHVDEMVEVVGGEFGAPFDPARVQRVPWGSLQIVDPVRDIGDTAVRKLLRWSGPAAWGSGETPIFQLTLPGNGREYGTITYEGPIDDFRRAGTYYDPQHPAGGWVVSQHYYPDPPPALETLAMWFTWDTQGRPTWLYGQAPTPLTGPLRIPLRQAISGGRFEPGYSIDEVQFRDWGQLNLSRENVDDCKLARIGWASDTPGYASGEIDVERLTQPTLYGWPTTCAP